MAIKPTNYIAKRLDALDAWLSGDDLVVLIWGPGKQDPNYTKRVEIRTELVTRYPKANIYFSEDEAFRRVTRERFPALPDEELAHAAIADIVFALDTSKGVGQEVAKYAEFSSVREKLVVLSHRRYKNASSVSAAIRRGLAVEYYSDKDFAECNIAKRICVKHVNAVLLRRIARKGRQAAWLQ